MIRMRRQIAFVPDIALRLRGAEQVGRGLADPRLPRVTGQALPGAIELQKTPVDSLAKHRDRIQFDQILGQLHLVRQRARAALGDFLGAPARARQYPHQTKQQE